MLIMDLLKSMRTGTLPCFLPFLQEEGYKWPVVCFLRDQMFSISVDPIAKICKNENDSVAPPKVYLIIHLKCPLSQKQVPVSLNTLSPYKLKFHTNCKELKKILGLRCLVKQAPGACFTKHRKPMIFLSAIQIVWHLRKS